jgi:hypothetical protein
VLEQLWKQDGRGRKLTWRELWALGVSLALRYCHSSRPVCLSVNSVSPLATLLLLHLVVTVALRDRVRQVFFVSCPTCPAMFRDANSRRLVMCIHVLY